MLLQLTLAVGADRHSLWMDPRDGVAASHALCNGGVGDTMPLDDPSRPSGHCGDCLLCQRGGVPFGVAPLAAEFIARFARPRDEQPHIDRRLPPVRLGQDGGFSSRAPPALG